MHHLLSLALLASLYPSGYSTPSPAPAIPSPYAQDSTIHSTAGQSGNPIAAMPGDFCTSFEFTSTKPTWYDGTQYGLMLLAPADTYPAANSLLVWTQNATINATLIDGANNATVVYGQYLSAKDLEYHATVCYSGGSLTLAVNGVTQGTQAVSGSWSQPAKLNWFTGLTAPTSSTISNLCFSVQRSDAASNPDPHLSVALGCGEFHYFPRAALEAGTVPPETPRKKVALIGDSQCDPTRSLFYLTPLLRDRLRAVVGIDKQVDSYCVGGAKATVDRADTVVAPAALTQFNTHVAGAGYDVVVVMIGVNDLLTGSDAATASAALTSLYDTIRGTSTKLVIVNLYALQGYAGATSQMLTDRDTVRANVVAYGAAHTDVRVVDPEAVTTSSCSASACFDHLHWNETSVLNAAGLIGDAVALKLAGG